MRAVATIGRWSARHPWLAIVGWVVFVVARTRGGRGHRHEVALERLRRRVGARLRPDERPRRLAAVRRVRLRAQRNAADERPGVPRPRWRTSRRECRRRSAARRSSGSRPTGTRRSWSTPRHGSRPRSARLRAYVLEAAPAHPQVTIGEAGAFSASDARDRAGNRDLHRAELLSVPVTLFVLLFAFGSLVAALVPVVLALTAVAAAFGLLGPISQVFPLDDSVKVVVLLIGMAVGVDYALFYVVRSREERSRGRASHEALERTARTSGRTVLVSGTTVIVAIAGLFVIDSNVFNAIASGTIAVVACAVAGSVTVLPAILELLGPRLDRGRIPFLPHLRTDGSGSPFWSGRRRPRAPPAPSSRSSSRPACSSRSRLPALSLHVEQAERRDALVPVESGVRDARPRSGRSFRARPRRRCVVVVGPASEQPAVLRRDRPSRAARRGTRDRPPAVHADAEQRRHGGVGRAPAHRRRQQRREPAARSASSAASSSRRRSAGSRASRRRSPASRPRTSTSRSR